MLTYKKGNLDGTSLSGAYTFSTVEYAKKLLAKSDTALADIVAKFYNYCLSAKEYRQYVTANQ